MHSDTFLLTPSFTVSLECFLDNTPALCKIIPGWKSVFGSFLKNDRNPLSGIQARSALTTYPADGYRNGTRARRLNRTPNIRVRSDLVVVENDMSNRLFILITNKRRVKILEMLWGFRSDSVISENVGNIKQVQAVINEFNFDKLCFRRKCWYAGKEFMERKCHNHFEFK